MCHLILFLPAFALPVFWFLPFSTALTIYLVVVTISMLIYFKIFCALRQGVMTGQEGMVGKKGIVIQDIAPEGKIQYATEIWDAIAQGKNRFFNGESVQIIGIRGLRVLVEEITIDREKVEKSSCH